MELRQNLLGASSTDEPPEVFVPELPQQSSDIGEKSTPIASESDRIKMPMKPSNNLASTIFIGTNRLEKWPLGRRALHCKKEFVLLLLEQKYIRYDFKDEPSPDGKSRPTHYLELFLGGISQEDERKQEYIQKQPKKDAYTNPNSKRTVLQSGVLIRPFWNENTYTSTASTIGEPESGSVEFITNIDGEELSDKQVIEKIKESQNTARTSWKNVLHVF